MYKDIRKRLEDSERHATLGFIHETREYSGNTLFMKVEHISV